MESCSVMNPSQKLRSRLDERVSPGVAIDWAELDGPLDQGHVSYGNETNKPLCNRSLDDFQKQPFPE